MTNRNTQLLEYSQGSTQITVFSRQKGKVFEKHLVFLLTKLHGCKGYYAVSFVFVKLDFILKALLLYFRLDLVAKEIGLNIVLTTICLQDLQDLDSD